MLNIFIRILTFFIQGPRNTREHPEATYNLVNSPHLRPAFILDRVVKRLARDIGEGAWVDRDIPKVTNNTYSSVFLLLQRHVSGGNLKK